jgi:hypothetical protein
MAIFTIQLGVQVVIGIRLECLDHTLCCKGELVHALHAIQQDVSERRALAERTVREPSKGIVD